MKKLCSSQNGSDRISFLPDEIQSHIIRNLSLDEAIKTSILSTRWRQTYSSLSKLGFIQTNFHRKSDLGFFEVIDQVLRAHNDLSIDDLLLIFDVDDAPAPTPLQMNEWISFAVNHHVQHLFFLASLSSSYTLPHSLVTCTSLRVLRMRNVHINFQTTPLYLPKLEELQLFCCQLIDAKLSTSSCPMLENLVMYACKFDTLYISSSTLEYLEIDEPINHSEISLSAPSLTAFYYIAEDPPNITAQTLVSLEYVRVRIKSRNHSNNWDLVRKMFEGLDNVRELELSNFYVECLRTLQERPLVATAFSYWEQ